MVIFNFVTNVVEAWINPDHASEDTTLIMSKVLRSHPHAYSARSYCIDRRPVQLEIFFAVFFAVELCGNHFSMQPRLFWRNPWCVCVRWAVRQRSIGSESTRRPG